MAQHCCNNEESDKNSSETKKHPKSERITVFKVKGLDCADEVSAINNAFAIASVQMVDANIMSETVTVYHNKDLTTESIHLLIEKAGLKVASSDSDSFFSDNTKRIYLVGSSGITLGAGLLLDWIFQVDPLIINVLFFFAITLAGIVIAPKAWRSISKFHLDMNVLMVVAVTGAVLIGEFSEAASVLFLFSLAELLEAMSVSKARKAIKDVLKVAPKEAFLVDSEGKLKSVQVEELSIGNIILVKPGENIPIDGTVVEGKSSVNQASLTGESAAVSKTTGDTVWAGTINESGVLKVQVEKTFKETKIAKVIALIEDAQAQKAPSQRFVDKFASIYTPAVMLMAVFVALLPPLLWSTSWEESIYKALVLLVIGCPCALVIATPVSVVSGLTSLARRGVLVKGGVHLEALGKLKAIALDKTGTVTNGTPKITELKSFSDYPKEKIIEITASLESMSTHPLAKAVLTYADEHKVQFPHPTEYNGIPGKGAEGMIDGHWYFVGNHVMAHELGICSTEIEDYLDTVETKAMSVIVLGHKPHGDCKGEIIAVFAVGDEVKANIKESILDFHKNGINSVSMLSGDNQKTVDSVAKIVGIDYAKGALLPEDKVSEIKQLVSKYKYVGMVGDGVNDAPAMAHATLGIAMGVAGSDTAIETADIALMKDDISELPKAIAHGRRVLHIIQFNIFFAILIKAVFFILAFMGQTTLWMAVAADMGASLFVTFNALRLLKMNQAHS